MTEEYANSRAGESAPRPRTTAGALLRSAREAAGLSIDAVAQQLKLAPRQVTALEEDDYTHLPGRTFVRGHVRNYARFVRLEVDAVLGALPVGAAAPALAAPTLQQTAPTMGELPVTEHGRPWLSRWAIPLILVAVVAIAALYEWFRPAGNEKSVAGKRAVTSNAEQPAAPTPVPPSAGTPLRNPLATAPPTGTPASPNATTPAATTVITAATAPPAAPAAVSAPGANNVELVLTFHDFSWTEVKDRDGRVIFSQMNPGGTTQTVAGASPFELVIGNAADVRVRYNGMPMDIAPHIRQNVARFTLP